MLAAACGTANTAEVESLATGGPVGTPSLCDYPMALGTPDHVGRACPTLHGLRVAAVLPQYANAADSVAANGFVQSNEGPTLTMGDFVAVPTHAGTDAAFHVGDTWGIDLWKWSPSVLAPGATLQHVAAGATSWLAVDTAVRSIGFTTNGYVQALMPAFANGRLYLPQASGRIAKIDPTTGATLSTIDPFSATPFSGDTRLTTAGGLTVAPGGTIYYTATAWPLGTPAPFGADPRGSWLVRIAPDDSTTIVPWVEIASAAIGVTQRNDFCLWPFTTGGTPDATGPDSEPPQFHCGFQRPVLNAAPTIRRDGQLILFSGGNNNIWEQYLIRVDAATLAPVGATALREHFHDACGVRIPLTGSGDFGDACDVITAGGTTHLGFDPEFNRPGSLRAGDLDSNNAFCLPDGSCGVGGYDGGFAFGGDYDARGAIDKIGFDGTLAATNEEFGWDVTPTVWAHDGIVTLVQDRDLFSDLDMQVARYSSTFELESKSNVPIDFNATAIEFLDQNSPVDTDGHSYGYNANGHFYQFGADGQMTDLVALIDPATGAPCAMDAVSGFMARDRAGRVYVPACGNVYVIESSGATSGRPDLGLAARVAAPTAAQRASSIRKMASVARAHDVVPPLPQ
jgi:hypothetical protein